VKASETFTALWQQQLSDYVTAIVWLPADSPFPNHSLLAASAAGEITVFAAEGSQVHPIELQAPTDASIDALALAHTGQFVAAGGQSGEVKIWRLQAQPELIATLENAPAWVDRLVWHPAQNLLAFSLGRYVQVWDADTNQVVATLHFENSTVLDITWDPAGDRLAVSGYQGIKVWSIADWDADPTWVEIPSASQLIAWSPDGKYIASGNIDRTISVIEWENPGLPWVMQGFSGKIRQVSWSDTALKQGAPLLATSSSQSIVVWERHPDETIGWEGKVLGQHDDTVEAMQFQPGTSLLATAGADGWVVLWQKLNRIGQMLQGAPGGFSQLAWHPKAQQFAAGGQRGELIVWKQTSRGQGFG
jgi:WD40 repeat protein